MPPAPDPLPDQRRAVLHRPAGWRVGSALVLVIAAVLAFTAQRSSEGVDLRPGRYPDLASLVSNESHRVARQQAEVVALTAEVNDLSKDIRDPQVDQMQRKAAAISGHAGLQPVTGPGITVTLSDAPPDEVNASNVDLNRFVVHQQDIQAVVNAMWAGGARAVTVQGKRIISTTGIKCEGNSVTLQGVPYPQPYVISAVGMQTDLLRALEVDPAVGLYRADAIDPAIGVGWDLSTQSSTTAPAYDGPLGLSYAKVLK